MHVKKCNGKATTDKGVGYYKSVRNKRTRTTKAKAEMRKKYDGT